MTNKDIDILDKQDKDINISDITKNLDDIVAASNSVQSVKKKKEASVHTKVFKSDNNTVKKNLDKSNISQNQVKKKTVNDKPIEPQIPITMSKDNYYEEFYSSIQSNISAISSVINQNAKLRNSNFEITVKSIDSFIKSSKYEEIIDLYDDVFTKITKSYSDYLQNLISVYNLK